MNAVKQSPLIASVDHLFTVEQVNELVNIGWRELGSVWQKSFGDSVLFNEIDELVESGNEVARLRVYHPEQWEDIYFAR
jgi:hypothetical protein